MDKKETVINVRSSAEFKEQVEAYAHSLGLSTSAFIRMIAIEKMKTQ